MSKFGWSYPPGCSGPPDDDAPDPHPLSDEVCGLLEDAGVDQATIDRICGGIDALAIQAHADCPACEARAIDAAMASEPQEQPEPVDDDWRPDANDIRLMMTRVVLNPYF